MELEISIEDLLDKRRVESDRIEFKAGWNWMIFTVVSVHLRMILIMLAAGTLWLA